ncbi:hypothetical protein FRAHR75_600007 [Frankia sp. Hr75.2]|nr:hypothetical protein FRAHR75_600007 [Frankia sp. Hr75.2]
MGGAAGAVGALGDLASGVIGRVRGANTPGCAGAPGAAVGGRSPSRRGAGAVGADAAGSSRCVMASPETVEFYVLRWLP